MTCTAAYLTPEAAGCAPGSGAAAHHEPRPGFGLLSFSALGIVAVKAAWERGVAAGEGFAQYGFFFHAMQAARNDTISQEVCGCMGAGWRPRFSGPRAEIAADPAAASGYRKAA